MKTNHTVNWKKKDENPSLVNFFNLSKLVESGWHQGMIYPVIFDCRFYHRSDRIHHLRSSVSGIDFETSDF